MQKSWIMINWDHNQYNIILNQIGKVTIDYNEIKVNKRTEFPFINIKR